MKERETEKVSSDADFQQGDILKIEHGNCHDPHRMGVIINADCDLLHNKTDGVIAYLPIYSFTEYLKYFWAPKYISSIASETHKEISSLLKLDLAEVQNILQWLEQAPESEVVDKIAQNKNLPKKDKEALLGLFRKLSMCQRDPLEAFSFICKNKPSPETYARKQIDAAKKDMGDGHFFVTEIDSYEDIGFVVRLRRIYSIEKKHCFTSMAAQKIKSSETNSSAIRIAKFSKIYQFKLAQLFALQFSKIGLPDEISKLSSLVTDELVVKLTKEEK